jgi:proteasome alpha subunit
MPFYASVEQLMRDRSELARKGIGRGRSVIVLTYANGVLFVAENHSTALHKVSEIYDRIGFAAVGRYNEFENLRTAGIRLADVRGYSYDRRDVTGKWLANAYAQTLGAVFTEQQKPFEVELCVAEVGTDASGDQLYRITYDGSITDEPQYVVMGGQTDPISTRLKESYQAGLPLDEAIAVALQALQSPGTGPAGSTASTSSAANGGTQAGRVLGANALEVAVLERGRPRRAFRRITGAALSALLPPENRAAPEDAGPVEDLGSPEEPAATDSPGPPEPDGDLPPVEPAEPTPPAEPTEEPPPADAPRNGA